MEGDICGINFDSKNMFKIKLNQYNRKIMTKGWKISPNFFLLLLVNRYRRDTLHSWRRLLSHLINHISSSECMSSPSGMTGLSLSPLWIWALTLSENLTNNFTRTFQTLHFLIKIVIKDSIFTGWQGQEKRPPEDFDTFKFSLQKAVRNLQFCCTYNCRD